MDAENLKKIDFAVEKSPVYRMVEAIDGNTGQKILVPEIIPGWYETMRPDNPQQNKHFKFVGEVYELVKHVDVCSVIEQNILPQIGMEIEKEVPVLFAGGAILFYNYYTKSSFKIGDSTLTAVVSAVNSYNTDTQTGLSISFYDEKGTMYLPTAGAGRVVYSMDSFMHRKGAVKFSKFTKLAKSISGTVVTTVQDWKIWDMQDITFERLELLCKYLKARLAKNVLNKNTAGTTRFGFYKSICEHLLSREKMQTASFNYLAEANKLSRMMRDESLFTMPIDDLKAKVAKDMPVVEKDKEEEIESEVNYQPSPSGEATVNEAAPENLQEEADDLFGSSSAKGSALTSDVKDVLDSL